MNVGVITIIVAIVIFVVLKSIIRFSLKLLGIGILAIVVCLTIMVCTEKPDMHKPFSMDTVEYLLKINKDGSYTTTKQVTKTVYQKESH